MTTIARQFAWPDAAGTPTDPGATFAAVGAGPVYEVGEERDVLLVCAVTGADCRAIQIQVEAGITTAGVAAWYPYCVRTILGTVIGSHATVVKLPAGARVRVSARRFGGTANTRLTIRAQARVDVGEPNYNGQPLELARHQSVGIECWGDGAGAAVAPPASPAYAPNPAAAGSQLRIPTGEADTLVIRYTVAVLSATTIEFVVQESVDDGATFRALPAVSTVVGGVIDTDVGQESPSGVIGTYITREIAVRPGTLIRVDAQRTGGGAGTTLLAYAHLYKLGR